jgi:hypothetical protein
VTDNWRRQVYDAIASSYDVDIEHHETAASVEVLRELAGGGGAALELGIGTGRVAIPLSQASVKVTGIDFSAQMLSALRDKPGAKQIVTHLGDFADVEVPGKYSLVFCLANTFFGLPTQKDQVRCFMNVREHLHAGGYFLLETFVPNVGVLAMQEQQRLRLLDLTPNRVRLAASTHDGHSQVIESVQLTIDDCGVQLLPERVRYAWLSELDLMAELAGLVLAHRWSNWARAEYQAGEPMHISLWQR